MRLPVGVSRAVAVVRGSTVLVLGGLAPGDSTTGRVWTIDPDARTARESGSLGEPVHDASGAFLDGAALVFGGGAASGVADVQECTGSGTRVVGRLPQPRSDDSAAVVGGVAFVVGGFDGHSMARDVLATSTGRTFRVAATLRLGVRYPAVAAVGRFVYVIGGELANTEGTLAGGQTADIQRIDTVTGRVVVLARLPRPLGHATAFAIGGRLFVAGGRHGATATSDILEIAPATGRARRVGRLPLALSDAAAAVIGSTAYLVGGETSGPADPVSTVTAVSLGG
jgi:hypothetical protein